MRLLLLPAYLIIGLLLSGLSLDAQSKTLDLESFDGLSVSGNINLILIPDSENYAEINVEDTKLEKLETIVKGSTLKFKLKNKGIFNLFGNNDKAYIKLHYTDNLVKIKTSAAADITSKNIIESDDLRLSSSSGSSIELEIECNTVDASVSSGADIELDGAFEEQDISASSGGRYEATDVASKLVSAKASSGGSIRVWASEKLRGRASSGGSVNYKGNPSDTDTSSSSGGSVRSINARK